MPNEKVKTAHSVLCARVMRVAALYRRCALAEGAGRIVWWIGLPLLVVLLLQAFVGLPFYLRLPILPLAAAALLYLAWRFVGRPLLERFSTTRAALLVEARRPELSTRLVSAIEIYPDLEAPQPRFDRSMVHALILNTHRLTEHDDLTAVIDRRPARQQLFAGGLTLALWLVAFAFLFSSMTSALWSMGSAWGEVRGLVEKVSGAKIVIDPLKERAYLKGATLAITASEQGFYNPDVQGFARIQNATEWKPLAADHIQVGADGRIRYSAENMAESFEIYFMAGRIESDRLAVTVTERPRIANLTVEYTLPDYARRAPITQQRSDGNLETVYGSTLILTLQANKTLKSAKLTLKTSTGAATQPTTQLAATVIEREERMSISGEYARAILRLDNPAWLQADGPIARVYTLALQDEYGFANADAGQEYRLTIVKDQPPKLQFVGLPHRSSADEPHALESALAGIPAVIQASDDFGISKITLHYRLEDLETGAPKTEGKRENAFALPRSDIPQLSLLRFSELNAVAGDRIVFWAEAEDAYDLEPAKGPHKVKTPAYRIAVVSQEEKFTEAIYRDDWSTQWYDNLKVATLSRREIPPRQSPDHEAAAVVAKKLLDAPQSTDNLHGSDKQLIQDYFDSLNVIKR